MAVTVTTAAEHTNLTTIPDVKAALGVSSSRFDKTIERLIEAATNAIEEFVMHVYARQTYSETLAGSAHPVLLVTHVPIVGTPTVVCDSSPITDFIVQDAEAGSLYRELGWAVRAWVGWDTEPRERQGTSQLNYTITYEAGYIMPGEEDRDLPKQIEQACVETVVAWYRGQRRDPAVKSKKVGDLALTYGDAASGALGLPATARALLSRRVR